MCASGFVFMCISLPFRPHCLGSIKKSSNRPHPDKVFFGGAGKSAFPFKYLDFMPTIRTVLVYLSSIFASNVQYTEGFQICLRKYTKYKLAKMRMSLTRRMVMTNHALRVVM